MIRFFALSLLLGSMASAASAADVVVEIRGVEARAGALQTSLQTRSEFMKEKGLRSVVEQPAPGVVRITFSNVPAGEYAFNALHDLDGNGRMTLSKSYIPSDGWAMVGGEKLQGAPTFDDVKFVVGSDNMTVRVKMTYFDGNIPSANPAR